MATAFHLELVTPERVLFSGETEEVSLRDDGGEISFLAHHEDFIAAVDITDVVIFAPNGQEGELHAAVHGGFVEVNKDGVTLLAGVAELANEIDVERAQRALSRAEERLASPEAPSEVHGDSETGEAPEQMSGAMLALLAPESAEAAARRVRTRLAVAGSRSSS